MKLAIVFLAVLGLACGKPLPTGRVQDDLKEFLEIVPTDKLLKITLNYLYYDKEVKEFVVYIQSEKFPEIQTFVEHMMEYKECLQFINEYGVDVYEVIKEVHDILELHPYEPSNTSPMGVGINKLIEDVISVLPLSELKVYFNNKMETREYFRTMVKAVKSPVVMKMVNNMRTWPEYKELLKNLREKVVDVDRTIEILRELYWRGPRKVQEDLKELMTYVPQHEIFEIVLDYLSNDKEVKEFIVYMQSEEFPKIHKIVEYLKEYINCPKFFNEYGVDIYAVISEIHYILGLPPINPINTARRGVGINGLIDDVIAILPLCDLKSLFEKKMETREYFNNLVTAIKSPEFLDMVDTLQAWPKYQELLEKIRVQGVDVDRCIELLRTLFSLSWRGNCSLHYELIKFMTLFPTDQILDIVMDYLYNDKEVKEFVVYIQSEEFPKIHKIVEYVQEYKDCSKFINEYGVDVYAIIKQIHDTLRFPPFEPMNTTRNGVGFRGLIEDVIAVLPLEELKETEIRECIKILYTAIQSPVFRKMVDTLQDWPEYKEIREYLQGKGVDVDRYIELLRKLYSKIWQGIHILQEDMNEFLELVPPYRFFEIVMDYLAYDPEVQEFVVYIQSEEFPKIHKIVEYLKEYKPCLNFINEYGVDVYAVINKIYETLGYPPFEPTNTIRTGVGFLGLKDDMIAVLPLDALKSLIETKMETREYLKPLVPVYKKLVKTIQSPVFRDMVNTVRAMMVDFVRNWAEYQKQFEMLQEKVLNKDRIIELLKELRKLYWQVSYILKDDLKELMSLVPTEKVLEITLDYLAYDPELQEFLVYIQSEKFRMVHTIVEYLKQYKPCLKFIDERGVNIYKIINKIHDILGYLPYEPTNTTRSGVGIQGLKEDVISAFPLNDLKAYVEKKMETRQYFRTLVTAYKTLVKTIQSPEFLKMVNTLRSYMVETVQTWPEYQKLVEMLREKVFDEDRIIELLRELRERVWQGTYILKEDLKEFMTLVPTEMVLNIILDYLAYDPKLQEFLVYIQSEEFPLLHRIVEYLKEYKDRLQFINDSGVDLYAIINKIHDTLGYPPFEPTNTIRTRIGFWGLKEDMIAAFPLEDWKALIEKKMETRQYFKILVTVYKTLVTNIRSLEFSNMVDTVRAFMLEILRALTEHQNLLEILREMGVDVDRLIELLRTLFNRNQF